jgi:hypothetical protein
MQPSKHTLCQKLFTSPILVETIWQIPPYYERNLLFLQLFCRNLQRVRHAFNVDENWSVTAVIMLAHTLRPGFRNGIAPT